MKTIEEEVDVPADKIQRKAALAQACGGDVTVLRQPNGAFTLRVAYETATTPPEPPEPA